MRTESVSLGSPWQLTARLSLAMDPGVRGVLVMPHPESSLRRFCAGPPIRPAILELEVALLFADYDSSNSGHPSCRV